MPKGCLAMYGTLGVFFKAAIVRRLDEIYDLCQIRN